MIVTAVLHVDQVSRSSPSPDRSAQIGAMSTFTICPFLHESRSLVGPMSFPHRATLIRLWQSCRLLLRSTLFLLVSVHTQHLQKPFAATCSCTLKNSVHRPKKSWARLSTTVKKTFWFGFEKVSVLSYRAWSVVFMPACTVPQTLFSLNDTTPKK